MAFEASELDWSGRLQSELLRLEARGGPAFGVYVRDLATGVAVSHHAEERWYIASSVKVPVAIAVLRAVEQGRITLDERIALQAGERVDGAGSTNRHPPGTRLTLRYLLEQMIVYSDNTASDMLIRTVGLDEVNAVTRQLAPGGFGPITTLGDVRRLIYAHLSEAALDLRGDELLRLARERGDDARVALLGRMIRVAPAEMHGMSLHEAYQRYYASGMNSARLDAYAELLTRLAAGQALGAEGTTLLLDTMGRVKTGPLRIKAGLPPNTRFAHKTGTQRERVCDSGIVRVPGLLRERQLVVAACTRGEPSLPRAERALRDIGDAIRRSGALARL